MEFIVITVFAFLVFYDKIRAFVKDNKVILAILGYFLGVALISVLASIELFDMWELF